MREEHEVARVQARPGPPAVIERIRRAINRHDLDALAACFEPDYRSEFPAHPDRAFGGHEQMRQNWSRIFSAVPDLEAVVLRSATDGDTVWAEWEWAGAHVHGAPFLQRGVTIHGVRHERTAWVRLYMEPVQERGDDIDAAVRGAER